MHQRKKVRTLLQEKGFFGESAECAILSHEELAKESLWSQISTGGTFIVLGLGRTKPTLMELERLGNIAICEVVRQIDAGSINFYPEGGLRIMLIHEFRGVWEVFDRDVVDRLIGLKTLPTVEALTRGMITAAKSFDEAIVQQNYVREPLVRYFKLHFDVYIRGIEPRSLEEKFDKEIVPRLLSTC